jgi:hypothetical protein
MSDIYNRARAVEQGRSISACRFQRSTSACFPLDVKYRYPLAELAVVEGSSHPEDLHKLVAAVEEGSTAMMRVARSTSV